MLRDALGEGDARPEPVGENIWRLVADGGSRDMLSLAVAKRSVEIMQAAGHADQGRV